MKMKSSVVRVRFAPSPTGFFHIGSARTALFNWLYARHTGGCFVLRIEDTDLARNTPEALDVLLKGMRWLGLDWDEGPEVGGPYGPYFQSQRQAIYQEYLERLRQTGRVYEQDGATYFKVSGRPQIIQDVIRGAVERIEEKDFVIFRSDQTPVFHFVNVVDDIAMNITHIVRGEDHLSNTSKHQELFEAFGAPMPTFAHLPLILKTTGPGKMSKRDQGSLLDEYIHRHFLPEAVVNYLCLLGWSPKENREILPVETIIELFELSAISKHHAHFDAHKLAFMNGEYVRQLPLPKLVEKATIVLHQAGLLEAVSPAYVEAVLALSQEKMRDLEEIPTTLGFFFRDDFSLDLNVKEKISKKGDPRTRMTQLYDALAPLTDFSPTTLEEVVQKLAHTHQVSTGEYIQPARFAVSGMGVGPSFYGMLAVLGQACVLKRLQRLIHML